MDAWTLVGVVVGALLSWGATWTTTGRQINAERALRLAEGRRSDALPVASRLISATDELWSANLNAATSIFNISTERHAYNQPDKASYLRMLEEQRVAAIGARKEAQRQALQP